MDEIEKNRVFKPLVKMTVPVIFGMLITFVFQLADTYFIGRLGLEQLAAMSFTYPVYILFVGLFMGMSSGVSSSVAKSLGEKNLRKAQSLSAVSLFFFVIVGMAFGLLGRVIMAPLFQSLGAKGNALSYIQDYMGIMFPGFFLLVGTLIMNSVLMAKGILIRTTLIMATGGLVNIVLDYLLIFGFSNVPAMGIRGASIATVLSWMVTSILMVIVLVRENMISFSGLRSLGIIANRVKEVLKIGLPAAAAQTLNPIAVFVLTSLIAQSGDSAIAAYGIVTKVESLGLTLVLALSVILTPFVAGLYGAKESDAIDKVVASSGRITIYWTLALVFVLVLWSSEIVSIFSTDPGIIDQSRLYFYIVSISLPAFGLSQITTSIFNGAQLPGQSLRITLARSVVLTVPLAWLGSLAGAYGIYAGISLANILGAMYARKLLNRWHNSTGSSLSAHNPILDYVDDFKRLFTSIGRKK